MPRRRRALALPILLLAPFATACAPDLPPAVHLVRQQLPASLVAPCPVPPLPAEVAGDGAFFAWVADLVEVTQGCDARMAAIRSIVEQPPAP